MRERAKLILFDIDGTLVDTEGAGLLALESGFFEAFPESRGRTFPPLDLRGATDGSVVAFLFEYFGIPDLEENRIAFFCTYETALRKQLVLFREHGKGRALPGVGVLLDDLANRNEISLGLLTGNIEAGARTKLEHFSIHHYFEFGAYGDDDPVRDRLGPIAIERARRVTGREHTPGSTIVIGDTLKDVSCAKALGARCIAVATGGVSGEVLKTGEPDVILEDFSDVGLTLKIIGEVLDWSP
ncbi:MAG: HAD family hydrolase [Verrucomicrobiota bacterium]